MPKFHTAARRLATVVFALTVVLPWIMGLSVHAPAHAKVFDPESFVLDNGLQVIVVTDRRAPIVEHMIWYKVGAADEPPGKSGLAHYLEHLMFKGTDSMGPGEFSALIARNGGSENAFTSYDHTGYFQRIARDRLALVMRHEADRMANLRITDAVALPERDVIREERRRRVDNKPRALLGEQIRAALFLNHHYGIPLTGWPHEIESLTTADARAFYRRWYAPNNAILIVAGDITAAELRPLAEATYGQVPARDLPARIRPSEPNPRAARSIEMRHPRVRQPSFSIHYLAPSYGAGERSQTYALQVLNVILGGGTMSRLVQSLNIKQGLAAGTGSRYQPNRLDLTSFTLYAAPRPSVDLAVLEAALRAEIATLRAEGVTEKELAWAKARLAAAAIYSRDDLSQAARVVGRVLTSGATIEDLEAWPEHIAAVTLDQVNSVAREVLRDENSVTGRLLAGAPNVSQADGGDGALPDGEQPSATAE